MRAAVRALLAALAAEVAAVAGVAVRLRLPLAGGDRHVQTLFRILRQDAGRYRPLAQPRVALPLREQMVIDDLVLPARLQAWFAAGAKLVSPPAWDAQVGQAILLLWRGSAGAFLQPGQPFAQPGDLVQ